MTVGQFYNKEDKIMAFKKVVVVGGGAVGLDVVEFRLRTKDLM